MNIKKLFSILFIGIFLSNSIFAMDEVTPLAARHQKRLSPRSSWKATVNIPNYCREIIQALNAGDSQEVLKLLNSFYKKIPSTLKNSTRKRTAEQNYFDFTQSIIQDSINYHVSLFICLAMCLSNSTIVQDEKEELASTDLNKDVICIKRDGSYIVRLLIKVTMSSQYLLEFKIFPGLSKDLPSVNVCISISEVESANFSGVDVSSGYKTKNFFKNMTSLLVPSSAETSYELEKIAAPNFSDEMLTDEEVGSLESAQYDLNKDIKSRLELIFNAIPKEYRVHLEQYAQFIIYGLVKFMGSCICDAEYITGEGRADLIIKTQRDTKLCGSIIELKRDKTGNEAADQVRRKKYVNGLDEDAQVIGLSIDGLDKDNVTIDCETGTVALESAVIKECVHSGYSLQISSSIPKPRVKKDEARKKRLDGRIAIGKKVPPAKKARKQ